MTKDLKSVCAVCGALFVEGAGWVEEHHYPCSNERYGWTFTDEVPIEWQRGTPKLPKREYVMQAHDQLTALIEQLRHACSVALGDLLALGMPARASTGKLLLEAISAAEEQLSRVEGVKP